MKGLLKDCFLLFFCLSSIYLSCFKKLGRVHTGIIYYENILCRQLYMDGTIYTIK